MKSANIILTKMAAKTRFNKARFFGLMLVLLTIAATTLYSTSSASRGSVQTYLAAASGSMTGVSPLNARDLILPAIMNRESGGLHWFPGFSAVPQPPPNPNISIFASDCTTPQNTFHPGDTVCATITGIPLVLNIRVDWLGVTNLIQLRGSALGGDPQNVTFTLPTDAGLGAWHINVTSESDSSVRASEIFYVSNPATPTANLVLSKLAKDPQATAGADVSFDVIITNRGPDAAANVQLTDTVPTGTTFVLGTQTGGPSFTCNNPSSGGVGTSTCTLSSLSPGDTAVFLFSYKVDTGATSGTTITNIASVTSSTTDPNTDDNTRSAMVSVAASPCIVTCPGNITTGNDPNQFGATVSYSPPSGSGNCGNVTTSQDSGSFFAVGTTVVTAAGDAGNGCSFTVTVNDTQTPTFTSCPTDVTVNENPAGSSSAIVTYANPTASDNDPAGATITCDHPSGSSFSVGTTPVICTATDAAGNANNSCTFNVTVTTECSITCPSNIVQNADSNSCGAVVTYDTPTTHNCSGNETVTQIAGLASGATFPVGTTTNTYKVTDGATTSTCSFTVTVVDNVAPSITCPATISVTAAGNSCQALVNVTAPSATDNCSHPPGVAGVRDDGQPLSNAYSVGTTTITWTATDAAGNSASCEQKVIVRDSTAPTASVNVPDTVVAGLMTVNADANCQAPVPDLTAYLTASDNCATHLSISQTPAADSGNGDSLVSAGAYPITIKVSDGDPSDLDAPPPNTTTLTQMNIVHITIDQNGDPHSTIVSTVDMIFTVVDATAPTITAPANGSYQCLSQVPAASPSQATASDNCGTPTVTVAQTTNGGAGSAASPLVITRTFTATDASGNHTSATQTITVIDDTPPTISCPANIVAYLPLNSTATSMAVTFPAPTASDNCGSVNVVSSAASGSVFPVGTTTITSTATDAVGNQASCTFTVTVLYDFTGFFSPVNNPPTLNVVNAGRAIPVKFSLSGNKGLSIFAASSPQSGTIPCDASAPVADLTDTTTAGGSSLSYDAGSDQYIYTWKTESSWAGTCRQLVVTLNDGSVHVANFKFR